MTYKEYLLELIHEYMISLIGCNKRLTLAIQRDNEHMANIECNIRENINELLNDAIEELRSLERSEK